MTGTVYLSGPITGLTYEEARFGWRSEFALHLHSLGKWGQAIRVLSPMRHEGHLAELKGPIEKAYPENLFSSPKMIVAKDFLDVKASDIVIANLWGSTKVSVGTMVELGYAKALGKTIIVIMEDEIVDHDYPKNPHRHPFVTELADAIAPSVQRAAEIVSSLLSEGV